MLVSDTELQTAHSAALWSGDKLFQIVFVAKASKKIFFKPNTLL